MRQLRIILTLLALAFLLTCSWQEPRSNKCFDDIRDMVRGRTAAEVKRLLGEPDSRQRLLLAGERWVWWNYTYLDGKDYPPEMRGRKVHLEIIFERKDNSTRGDEAALSDLRIIDPLAVSYTLIRQTL